MHVLFSVCVSNSVNLMYLIDHQMSGCHCYRSLSQQSLGQRQEHPVTTHHFTLKQIPSDNSFTDTFSTCQRVNTPSISTSKHMLQCWVTISRHLKGNKCFKNLHFSPTKEWPNSNEDMFYMPWGNKGKWKDPGFPSLAVQNDIKQLEERAAVPLQLRWTLKMNVMYERSMKWQESSERCRTLTAHPWIFTALPFSGSAGVLAQQCLSQFWHTQTNYLMYVLRISLNSLNDYDYTFSYILHK